MATIDGFLSELAEAGEARARKHKKLHKMVQIFFNEDDDQYERFHEEQAELAEPDFEDVPEEQIDEKARDQKYREVMIEGIQTDIQGQYQVLQQCKAYSSLKTQVLPIIRQYLLGTARVIITNIQTEIILNGAMMPVINA